MKFLIGKLLIIKVTLFLHVESILHSLLLDVQVFLLFFRDRFCILHVSVFLVLQGVLWSWALQTVASWNHMQIELFQIEDALVLEHLVGSAEWVEGSSGHVPKVLGHVDCSLNLLLEIYVEKSAFCFLNLVHGKQQLFNCL